MKLTAQQTGSCERPAAKEATPANDKQAMTKRAVLPDRFADFDAWFENRLDEIDNGR